MSSSTSGEVTQGQTDRMTDCNSRPKVLVPDTNILVDNLNDIKSLAESGDLSVVVPTTVVGELEGLSKETGRSSPGVKGSSRAALTWLREKPGKVRCVTTKGSVLNTFSLATEEDCSDGQVGSLFSTI